MVGIDGLPWHSDKDLLSVRWSDGLTGVLYCLIRNYQPNLLSQCSPTYLCSVGDGISAYSGLCCVPVSSSHAVTLLTFAVHW